MVEGSVQVDPDKPSPGASPREDRPYLRPLRPAPIGPLAWVIGVFVLLAGAGLGYYFWRSDRFEPFAGPPRAEQPAPPAPAAPPTPAIQHPLAAPEAAEALPPLAQSDGSLGDALAKLLGSDALAALLQSDRIVSRIVVTVDNLPRRSVPARMLPLKPVPGPFETQGGAAIDDLLATPGAKEPPALAHPGVLYQFADPSLETRSAGQKLMLRMGAENAARMKAKLREIRAELARHRARP